MVRLLYSSSDLSKYSEAPRTNSSKSIAPSLSLSKRSNSSCASLDGCSPRSLITMNRSGRLELVKTRRISKYKVAEEISTDGPQKSNVERTHKGCAVYRRRAER